MDKACIFDYFLQLRDGVFAEIEKSPYKHIVIDSIFDKAIKDLCELHDSSFPDQETARNLVLISIKYVFSEQKTKELFYEAYRKSENVNSIENTVRFCTFIKECRVEQITTFVKNFNFNRLRRLEGNESEKLNISEVGCIARGVGCLATVFVLFGIKFARPIFEQISANLTKEDYIYIFAVLIAIFSWIVVLSSIYYGKKATRLFLQFNKLIDAYDEKMSIIRKLSNDIDAEKAWLEKKINWQNKHIETILTSKTPFSYSATLAADARMSVFRQEECRLKYKPRPARKSAMVVSEMRKEAKEFEAKYKCMLYKYEFLLAAFPELKRYVDDEEALQSLDKEKNYEDFKNNIDNSKDYLSDEEWVKLSETERNQLALDRYNKRKKSNWTIGMLYEMYIGYLLRDQYDVAQYGIINGLEDLGRDIIASKKYSDGIERIYIIQCKNWSVSKEIHENVVCQIFGTAMEYSINHKVGGQKIIPVLCVTTQLSSTAKLFAERLGVKVYVKPIGEFPMIKCNINNGQKIYHLPFDQQYWRTKIEKPGEFYAWTVKEAYDKGFRRALRHTNYN